MTPAQRLSVLLLAGIGAAAALGAWSYLSAAPATQPVARPLSATAVSPPPSFERGLDPLDRYGETAARPLFAEGRRPVAPPPVPAAATPRPALRLDGVIVIGARKEAVLKDTASNQRFRVSEGDGVVGWTVRRIERDRVVLGAPEHSEEITLTPGRPTR
jgi:hypothetical protein